MSKSLQKTYKTIDVIKLICAILVLLLHCIETSDFTANSIKFIFTRFAVPYFFIVSGFFLCKGLENNNDKKQFFKKHIKNLVKIFVIWALIIYSPFVIYNYIKANAGKSVLYIILVLIRRFFVIGPGPYWYLLSLCISSFVIFLFDYIKKEQFLYLLAIFGFVLLISYSSFNAFLYNFKFFASLFKLISLIFSWEFNFIMFGIPFMVIGYFFAKHKININIKVCIAVFVLATMGRILEYYLPTFIKNDFLINNQINICYIFQSISLFYIAMKSNVNISYPTSLLFRQLSSFIYFSHDIILYNILNPIMDNYTNLPTYSVEMILPKLLVVLSICVILFMLIKNSNNRVLNNLIN